MRNWLSSFIDAVLPPRCLICGKVVCESNSLCVDCFEKINFITSPYCQRCGRPLFNDISDDLFCASCLNKRLPFRYSRSAIEYDDFSKKLILDFKFLDHIENKTLLSRWLFSAGKDIFSEGVDLIVPVPLHVARLFKRKYNQSAILAQELSKLSGILAEYKALKKVRHTRPQVQCGGSERAKNVRNAFEIIYPERIKGKRVVLIDDVFTTGATIKECTKVLKKAGALSVDALTIARVCK